MALNAISFLVIHNSFGEIFRSLLQESHYNFCIIIARAIMCLSIDLDETYRI